MRFKVYYEDDKKLKSISLDANSKSDLKENENYPYNVVKIKEISKFEFQNKFIIKNDKEILEIFYEMSTMLEAKLSIDEVLEILLNTKFSKNTNEVLLSMRNALANGYDIHKALQKHQKYIGYLPIIFFKIGERNSNLAESISSLYNLLNENYIINQKLKSATSYPIMLLFALLTSLIVIFIYVIPKFEYIFSSLGDDLPLSTFMLLFIKDFVSLYYVYIFLSLFIIYILTLSIYKKYQYFFDEVLISKIPYVSSMYKYTVFYKLFLSLYLIVKSKFQFQNALISVENISSNLYVRTKIKDIIQDINNGMSISRAFEKTKLFDNIAIRLLLTAQKTNKIETILFDIQQLYKKRLMQYIKKLTLVLEPLLMAFISSIVLWLVLAIMTPIWQMGTLIK
ncbi:MAG TPA: type II secretion system F family protein [Arcobacter sp.]|nr:type II secretion system F family protein [Arcobacter sp.]HIP56113.1 type II secretion system F family protein [Arcobacter sp.]